MNVDLVEDKKKRRLLLVHEDNRYYLLDKRQEKYVTFLKNNLINAISIGAILGYFIKLPYWGWGLIALVVYAAYLLFFNTKIFPGLTMLKEKKIQVLQPSETKKRMLLFTFAFLAVGIGLLLCIPLGQANGTMESSAAVVGGIFSIFMGLRFLSDYRK